jgi:hypothetical protein
MLVFAFALPLLVPLHAQNLNAPNKQAVVAQVITDHPEINACDEAARGAIVDYAAQRLNAGIVPVWGRKSRNHQGTDLNTDGLTFLRPDGKFEIYDAISGSAPCGATWDGFGPFAQGQNGFWVPPQLAPEGQTPPPPPPADTVTTAQLQAAIAQARADLLNDMNGALRELRASLEHDIADNRGLSLAEVNTALDVALARLVVIGKTRTAFAHQHAIELGVVKK